MTTTEDKERLRSMSRDDIKRQMLGDGGELERILMNLAHESIPDFERDIELHHRYQRASIEGMRTGSLSEMKRVVSAAISETFTLQEVAYLIQHLRGRAAALASSDAHILEDVLVEMLAKPEKP